jgi:hypothetical protein
MEENKIETPLSEIDSNVTTEETVVVNETESNDPSSELDGEDVVEAFENDPDVQKLKANEEELIRLMANPDVMRAYKAAKRVGERRQVSKKENKKKKAKRRMAKKSKR